MARVELIGSERSGSHRAQTTVLHVGCQHRASEEAKPGVQDQAILRCPPFL
jgi:hypothetical protein